MSIRYYELEAEELAMLKDFEAGVFKPVKNQKKELANLQSYAKESLDKTRNINIRLSYKDLQKIKAAAAERGLPYQTLISSLLHRFSSGKLEVW